jgi:sialate O-acetylesterase
MRTASFAVLVALVGCSSGENEFRVSRLFGNHMVLQRDLAAPVWGWSRPGDAVVVRLAGTEAKAVAGPDGRWTARIGPLAAGGPYELRIEGRGRRIYSDVYVGDVFLCAGDSSMEWPLEAARNAPQEVAAAYHPMIRHFEVPKSIQPKPQAALESGAWQVCEPHRAGSWTAAGYFFARTLHRKLSVPIGLIHPSWGGTTAEAWSSAEALSEIPELKEVLSGLEKAGADRSKAYRDHEDRLAKWEKSLAGLDAGSMPGAKPWSDPETDVASWKPMEVPGYWEQSALPGFDGVVWFRRTVTIAAKDAGRDLTLSLGPIDDEDVTWWNGTRVGGMDRWDAPRRYAVPGALVKEGENILTVRVNDKGFGGGFHGKAEALRVEEAEIPLAGTWRFAVGFDRSKAPPKPEPPAFVSNPTTPTGHYNGMIAPLAPYALKGIVWVQGEANVGRAATYREVFPRLIQDWRVKRGQPELPFVFAQLHGVGKPGAPPGESAWAELREAQAAALSVTRTAMATAIDLGEGEEPNPKNKQELGRRLAQAALALIYGEKGAGGGPVFDAAVAEGSRLRLRFRDVGGGLAAKGGVLKGFAIAGEEGRWTAAEARIEGETVVVWSDAVPKPKSARYAWADQPQDASLTSKEGLPAFPFRTDR